MLKTLLAKIPSRIRITRKVAYELVFIDTFADPTQVGECRPDAKQIVIKKGQSDTETAKTILHEIIHALALENEFTLTERTVLDFEESIFRFLRLNKILEVFTDKE